MRKDERDVYFFDVISDTWNRKFDGLAPFPHKKLVQAIFKAYQADKASVVNSRKQAIYVADMRVHADRCEMLVGFSDTLAADPTFADHRKKSRRVAKKVGDEGLEHSAHIIWNYKNAANSANCNFLLESATGIPSSKIVAFFNRLLRIYSDVTTDFWVDDPEAKKDSDGNFIKIKTRPKVELVGHPSVEFLKDLKLGTLQEVELFTERTKGNPWDAQGRVVEDRASVTIKPNPAKTLPKAKALLDGFVPNSHKKYEFARIKFKTRSDVPRTVSVMSQNYSLLTGALYVRKERLDGLGDDLPTAFEKINDKIMGKMRALIQ